MSLNQWMHPKNPYKTPPDFKDLAIKFPEFRRVVSQDVSGKVHLDFSNPSSLACLTTTLLKRDFNLEVKVPVDRLIPTLPSRLNYLLWVQDLMGLLPSPDTEKQVLGLDIGVGASCIYPLLAVRHLRWRMVGTESNKENFKLAGDNVCRNGLESMISLESVSEGDIFTKVMERKDSYQFCMCNPPFFKPDKEFEEGRPEFVGQPSELIVSGGEVEFVTRMLGQSREFSQRVAIFTVLLGHKSSVAKVKRLLQEEKCQETKVASSTTTQFCQGKTMRWGVAWTFLPGVELEKVLGTKAKKAKSKPFSWSLPTAEHLPRSEQNAAKTLARLRRWLEEVKVEVDVRKEGQHVCCARLKARQAKWQRQRQVRRRERNKGAGDATSQTNVENCSEFAKYTETERTELSKVGDGQEDPETILLGEQGKSEEENPSKSPPLVCQRVKDTLKSNQGEGENVEKEPVLVCDLFIRWAGPQVKVDLCYIEGSAGREGVHQLLQFLKNKQSNNS